MPVLRPRALRTAAVTTALSAALLSGLVTVPTAQATERSAGPASTYGKRLLTAQFDGQSASIERGARFKVTGTVSTVTQAAVGRVGEGVPASFTLVVTDPSGEALATQDITAGDDGTFATMVPGSVTAGLPESDAPLTLGLRALDASYDDHAADDAGAGAVTVASAATDLLVENSFVSAVGWVKPGETYPSRVIVTNPTALPVAGATVTVTAPRGTSFDSASGPGTEAVTADEVAWTLPPVEAGGKATLVLQSTAATTTEEPTIVWRDLSLDRRPRDTGRRDDRRQPRPEGDPAQRELRHRPLRRPAVRGGPGQLHRPDLRRGTRRCRPGEEVINDPTTPGSTFNLFQEMSLGQLFPDGTVPSDGLATADFTYAPGFDFTNVRPGQT